MLRRKKTVTSEQFAQKLISLHFLVEHNVALAAADHTKELFKKMFPDSEIANNYSSARTKTKAIVKECAAASQAELVDCMNGPFVLGTDGSQEGGEKFFPIVVRALDADGNIKTELLATPTCEKSATGENMGPKTLDSLMILKSRKDGPCHKTVFSNELPRKCKSPCRKQLASSTTTEMTSEEESE
jgi:hypothetical protein